MDKLTKMLFLHFEKALVAVFGLALLYSIVFYGPWMGRIDLNARLQELVNTVDKKPLIGEDQVPALPLKEEEFPSAIISDPEKPVALDNMWWPLLDKPFDAAFLPPSQVAAEGSRGFVKIDWQINPNQPETDVVKPLGVEIQRAVITADGLGPFESLTTAGKRTYFTPPELFRAAVKYVPNLIENTQGPQVAATTARGGKRKPAYTLDDIINAWHDGRITQNQAVAAVRKGVTQGVLTADERVQFTENVQFLPEQMRTIRREARMDGKPIPSDKDLVKMVLESWGYHGGGTFDVGTSVVQAVPEAKSASPGVPAPKAAPEVAVAFPDVTTFVDTTVNPEQEYVYQVRFWTADTVTPGKDDTPTGWGPLTSQVTSKPDTDFYLSGVSIDQGVAAITVRKWVPSANSWVSHSYTGVAPGEEIGHIESISLGTGAPGAPAKLELVDFSTSCILLAFRYRPRSFEKTSTEVTIDPLTQQKSSVDKVERVLYDTPQIVYSDRKGKLRLKWQTSGNVS